MKKNSGSASDYRRQDGFTLIELLVIIAIIGILSSVILTSVNSSRVKASTNAAISTMRSLVPVFDDCLSGGISLPLSDAQSNGNTICSSYPSNSYIKLPVGWIWCNGSTSQAQGPTGCGNDTSSMVAGTSYSIVAESHSYNKKIICSNSNSKCVSSTDPD